MRRIVALAGLIALCLSSPALATQGHHPQSTHDKKEHSKPCSPPTGAPSTPQPETPATPGVGTGTPEPQPTVTPVPTVPAPTTPPVTTPTPPSGTQPPCMVCESRRVFTIRVAHKSDHGIVKGFVYYGDKTVPLRKVNGRWRARVTFKGQRYFPGQREVIGIRVWRKDGSQDGMIRRYRPCEPKLGFLNKPWVL